MPLARLLLMLFPVEGWADYRAQGLTDRALEYLSEESDAPLFLWVHYIDPHTPFQADPGDLDLGAWSAEIRQRQPEVLEDGTVVGAVFAGTANVRGGMLWLGPEDRQRIEEYYDRTISYVDREVGRLFGALRERHGERRVVSVLTSDHGEEFWDHGHFEHGHDYYREVTRIPMVIWSPGFVPSGRIAGGPVGLVDVAPTLLDLAGLEVPSAEAPDEGRSLVALLRSGLRDPPEGELDAGSSSGENRVRFSGGNLYGLPAVLLEDEGWRFILRANGAEELYEVFDDPGERHNRAPDHPELVERYRALLEPRLAVFLENRADAAAALDPETLKALQSLGYVQ
jgi:arylsulfatase A-like enzyme